MNKKPDQEPVEPPPHGCGDCKPGLIDCLRCKTEAIAKQAEYNAAAQPELEAASTAYDAARKAYRAKRREVELQVQDMRHEVKRLIDRLRCLIKQERVVECLDEAWCQVAEELDNCTGTSGCCADDLTGDFTTGEVSWECDQDGVDDSLMSEEDYEALVATITAYQGRVDKAKLCFQSLVKEPEALGQRVQAARADIDAINAALASDSATTDLKEVYAKALVARRHLRLIWNGFSETKDYADCLCRALTCWTTGSAAISVLTAQRAFEDCKRASRDKRCEKLRTSTVDEILARYDKLCPEPDCDGKEEPVDPDCPEKPEKPEKPHPPDTGQQTSV